MSEDWLATVVELNKAFPLGLTADHPELAMALPSLSFLT